MHFTNRDPRMRPATGQVTEDWRGNVIAVYKPGETMQVTDNQFRDLYREYLGYCHKYDINPPYKLVISENARQMTVDPRPGRWQITIPLSKMNSTTYGGLLFSLNHELGHFREDRNEGRQMRDSRFDARNREFAADERAACARGKRDAIDFLRNVPEYGDATHPSREERRRNLIYFDMRTCDEISPPPRRAAAAPRERE